MSIDVSRNRLRWYLFVFLVLVGALFAYSVSHITPNQTIIPRSTPASVMETVVPSWTWPDPTTVSSGACWEKVWPRVISETALAMLAGPEPFSSMSMCGERLCWNGIEPGVTPFDEVGEILSASGFSAQPERTLYRWKTVVCDPPFTVPGRTENFVFRGEDGFAEGIRVNIPPVTLRQIVEVYGPPERYVVHGTGIPDDSRKAIGLVYNRLGAVFLTPFESSTEEGIRPESNMVVFELWLQRQEVTKNLKTDRYYDFYPWEGFNK